MDKITVEILKFLEWELPKQGENVSESGAMSLISQVHWAAERLNLSEIDAEKAWDIAGEIYRHFSK